MSSDNINAAYAALTEACSLLLPNNAYQLPAYLRNKLLVNAKALLKLRRCLMDMQLENPQNLLVGYSEALGFIYPNGVPSSVHSAMLLDIEQILTKWHQCLIDMSRQHLKNSLNLLAYVKAVIWAAMITNIENTLSWPASADHSLGTASTLRQLTDGNVSDSETPLGPSALINENYMYMTGMTYTQMWYSVPPDGSESARELIPYGGGPGNTGYPGRIIDGGGPDDLMPDHLFPSM